ncbi:MAG: YceH family protein [bacterium]
MEIQLTPVEVRVLGALVEKEHTTPEYYPLTLNALTNACNQKSNRSPVVSYDEKTVVRALESLREKKLVLMVTGAGSRVPKYKHAFDRRFHFDRPEVAVLCTLMVRGPQTVGEIRGRTSRLYEFRDLDEVENTMQGLMTRGEGAYVVQLPRQPGRKESRYAHLFSGEPDIPEDEVAPKLEPARQMVMAENERLATLEGELQALRQEMEELRNQFLAFKKQFE